MRLTKEERVKIVELHIQNNGSVVSVQRNYRRLFGNETSPSMKCMKALVLKFKETGTTEDHLVVADRETFELTLQGVAASVADDPKTSTRGRCFLLMFDQKWGSSKRYCVPHLNVY